YYKIYRLLKQGIENHEFSPNDAMPGENALAERYHVSRLTIRRSLDLLQRDGLVERRQGSGTFPIKAAIKVQPFSADINKLLAHLNGMAASTRALLLAFSYEIPNPDVQSKLELAVNARVQKAIRVRRYEDAPFSYLTTYVPEHIGKRFSQDDLTLYPIQTLFKKLGIKLVSAEQSITAILADVQHAENLDMEVGSPLLCINRVIRDASNTPIEYLIAAYNPHRFEYRMAMSNKRTKGKDSWIMDENQ
ncbi:MAG: GntR family transcriptional regulator, partial [Paralcaligenes sp.]